MLSHADNERRYSSLREISRGYALVVTGMAIGLLLVAGLIPSSGPWQFMTVHASCMGCVAAGGWWWWKMPPLTAHWHRATHQFTLSALLQVYMVPFIHWWRETPQVWFFSANALVALAGIAWLFVQLCDVAAETGRILGDRTLRLEGQVGAWISPLLLLLPPAHGMVFSVVFYLNAGLPPVLDVARLILLWPEWIRVVMLLAPIIALAVSMEARLRCLAALRLLKAAPHRTLP